MEKFDKDKLKGHFQKGQLQWDGSTEHLEEIRMKYWPSWNKETFCRNWNNLATEFCVAHFKDGARARSANKGENSPAVCVHFVSIADPCLAAISI